MMQKLKKPIFDVKLDMEEIFINNHIKSTEKKFLTKFKLRYFLCIMSIIFFITIYITAYKNTLKPVRIEKIPFITRDISPIRIVPEEKGGMTFSNQDKEIYNNITHSPNKISKIGKSEDLSSEEVVALMNKIKEIRMVKLNQSKDEAIIQHKEDKKINNISSSNNSGNIFNIIDKE